jgi:hypothetical protein
MKSSNKTGLAIVMFFILCLIAASLTSCDATLDDGAQSIVSEALASSEPPTPEPAAISELPAPEPVGITLSEDKFTYSAPKSSNYIPDDLDITLEFVSYAPLEIKLVITNHSEHPIQYGSGFEITGVNWGNMGEYDEKHYDLPAGERREISVLPFGLNGFDLGFGEFQLVKTIIAHPDKPAATKTYKLQTEFALENESIPPEIQGIVMDIYFATPIGVIIDITNGFSNGRVFFDRTYSLQNFVDGTWQDVPATHPDIFPGDMQSIGSRQITQYTKYWDWLHGELPPGSYRIEKDFWHHTGDKEVLHYTLYAEFSLDGEPIPEYIQEDEAIIMHPFNGVTTFRAKVIELLDADYHAAFRGKGLLVESLPILPSLPSLPNFWEDSSGEPYYIWNNHTTTVLDINGKQIAFADIPQGAVLNITYSGIVLQSRPAHIGGSLLILIVA